MSLGVHFLPSVPNSFYVERTYTDSPFTVERVAVIGRVIHARWSYAFTSGSLAVAYGATCRITGYCADDDTVRVRFTARHGLWTYALGACYVARQSVGPRPGVLPDSIRPEC